MYLEFLTKLFGRYISLPDQTYRSQNMHLPTEDDSVLLPSAKVKMRFGGISDMTLWRWERNEKLGFPQPVRINRRRYYRLGDIKEFERRRFAAPGLNPIEAH
jgi:predicted DNA-binding transcriptional regulator AlpA